MRSVFAFSVALAGFTAAQSTTQNNYPYRIDPDSVSSADRQYWCDQNQAQCPLICLQQPGVTSMTTEANDCNPDDLTYNCVCDNGVSPNITEYSQTLPFFICQEWGNQCQKGCGNSNTCADACRADHPCGAQSPFKGNASRSASTSTVAPSATSQIPVTGFGGATSTPNTPGAAPGSFIPGMGLTMAAVFGSAFLGFAVLL